MNLNDKSFSEELFFEGSGLFLSKESAGDMGIGSKARLSFESFLESRGHSLFWVRQTHSLLIAETCGEESDAVFTNDPSQVLGVTVADCLPIYLVNTQTGSRGLAHSGWKGTGIAARLLRSMVDAYGEKTGDFIAYIGPSIHSCCYSVDSERASLFQAKYGEPAVRFENQQYFLDLQYCNSQLLKAEGIQEVLIHQDCTACNDQYGSFRRQDGGTGRGFTRMLAFM
jgi:YfiH family protein